MFRMDGLVQMILIKTYSGSTSTRMNLAQKMVVYCGGAGSSYLSLEAMLFVITDAHSKWVDVHLTKTTTAQETISKLRQTFATFGLPKIIVSDNIAVFTSSELKMFLSNNGIIHRRSSPYHPSTNGQAERMIQTIKDGLCKLDGSLETRLQRLLLSYRTTPHATREGHQQN